MHAANRGWDLEIVRVEWPAVGMMRKLEKEFDMTMTDATSTAVPLGTPTATPIGRVEGDMFCSGCQYNLHGLNVTLDERLQLPIVRCPECGKFHAAGIATGA